MEKWQKSHEDVIDSFLTYLNEKSDRFILKGGTALYKFYKLDRYSEDIDLDSTEARLGEYLPEYCKQKNYEYRTSKDTDITERYYIRYNEISKPLKVEASHRRIVIPENEYQKINNISVYNIESICIMKATAYSGRDQMRDVYDLAFICNNYYDQLSKQAIAVMRNAVEQKGIEHFDYIRKTQKDELISNEQFADSFLDMYNKLGLLVTENETPTDLVQSE